jgi:hypothetical protein
MCSDCRSSLRCMSMALTSITAGSWPCSTGSPAAQRFKNAYQGGQGSYVRARACPLRRWPASLRSLIECSVDLTVIGEAGSTPSARRLDLELLPDVVVLDLLLPKARGHAGPPGAPRPGPPGGRHQPHGRAGAPQAMVAGAHAFLEKHCRDVDDLLHMIRSAHRQNPFTTRRVRPGPLRGRLVRLGLRTAVPFCSSPAEPWEA